MSDTTTCTRCHQPMAHAARLCVSCFRELLVPCAHCMRRHQNGRWYVRKTGAGDPIACYHCRGERWILSCDAPPPPAPHHCHAYGCEVSIPPRMLMCKPHWFMVDPALRSAVRKTYRTGQEEDKRVSKEWAIAAAFAIVCVAVKEGRVKRENQAAEAAAIASALIRAFGPESG